MDQVVSTRYSMYIYIILDYICTYSDVNFIYTYSEVGVDQWYKTWTSDLKSVKCTSHNTRVRSCNVIKCVWICCLQTSSNQIEKGAWNKCKSIFISVYSMRKLHACLLHSKMTNLPSDSPNLSIDTPMSWYVAWVSHLCPLYFLCLLVILSWDFTSQPASFDLGVKTLELPRRA